MGTTRCWPEPSLSHDILNSATRSSQFVTVGHRLSRILMTSTASYDGFLQRVREMGVKSDVTIEWFHSLSTVLTDSVRLVFKAPYSTSPYQLGSPSTLDVSRQKTTSLILDHLGYGRNMPNCFCSNVIFWWHWSYFSVFQRFWIVTIAQMISVITYSCVRNRLKEVCAGICFVGGNALWWSIVDFRWLVSCDKLSRSRLLWTINVWYTCCKQS